MGHSRVHVTQLSAPSADQGEGALLCAQLGVSHPTARCGPASAVRVYRSRVTTYGGRIRPRWQRELTEQPQAVAYRLVGRLLRALGTDDYYEELFTGAS